VMDLKYLESELAKLVEEAGKYREYLEKLEAAKAEGKISETAYEKLKKEYVEKLSQLEKRIKEIEDIRKKLG
jgi:ppGpp synthetase/RelA/SpoT-type nucleotidyltranferase